MLSKFWWGNMFFGILIILYIIFCCKGTKPLEEKSEFERKDLLIEDGNHIYFMMINADNKNKEIYGE